MILRPFAQEKTPLTQPRSFFAGSSLSLLLDTIDTPSCSFFLNRFFFSPLEQNKSNEFHKTQNRNFFTAPIVT